MILLRKKIAFTLAEVLITLLIIGVVAVIIIPNLINDSQDAEFRAAWKKTYSEIAQATQKVMMDNGGTMKGYNGSTAFRNIFSQHVTFTKVCDSANSDNCWHGNAEVSKELSGKIHTWQSAPGAITNSGSFYHFWYIDSDCDFPVTNMNVCGWIDVDVNGSKGPNTMGKDMFGLYILENTILPYGVKGNTPPSTTCIEGSTAVSNTGWGCGAKYLYQ